MLAQVLNGINDFLWGIPFLTFVICIGLYFTVRSGFFPVFHFGHILKHTFCSMWSKEANKKQGGSVSPFEAVCIAIGGNVGCGTIGGVATAVATGGPGAVFWMWVWAFFGMMVKIVETSLGCHYRSKNENGEYYGGSTHFMEKGIGRQMKNKGGFCLAAAFGTGFVAQVLGGSQAYTIAEILKKSFGFDMIVVTVIYSAFLFYIIFNGTPRIAAFSKIAVPLKTVGFVIGGGILILLNYQNIPNMFYMIFHDAFTGTAATGGFVGAAVAKAIGDGVARSINANEAGQGSSPLIYGSADTVHPVRQGLWGAFDVFINTMVVCTVTALAVLSTGVWTSGVSGATLTIMAFQSGYGTFGVVFIGIIALLFGITTTSGWFTFYVSIITHGFREKPVLRDKLVTALKYFYPIPNIVIVSSIVLTGNGPDLFWTMVNITLVAPVFTNLLGLFILRNKFWELFKDYKARYMGIGQVDPNFHVFYEDDPEVFKVEEAIREEARQVQAAYDRNNGKTTIA